MIFRQFLKCFYEPGEILSSQCVLKFHS
jgi:hypothetical protein